MEKIRLAVQAAAAGYGAQTDVALTRPEADFGDFATNAALQLARQQGRNPRELAEEIAKKLQQNRDFQEVSVAGPGFINLRLTDEALLELILSKPKARASKSTVVIETNNPNPFKAMHIGHAMNAIVADTVANLLEADGARVYRVSYHGDIGLHVGKSMYALLKYTENAPERLLEVPEAERNEFMSKMYAEGARAYKEDETAKTEIDRLAEQSFTRSDQHYAKVYDTVFDWSFREIDKNVKRLGNKPVKRRFLESEADLRGVKIVRGNVPGVFQESDGALIFKGSEHGSFDNVFVSSKGQGLYGARDLGLIQLKNEQYHPEKSYIVTAEEQKDYFRGILAAADLCFPELKGVTVNLPTGMVKLSTGKMSSREGDVITIGWLFDQIAEAIRARGGEAGEDVVAGALRYAFLRVKIGGDIVFDINESVSIQGNSGPYLQYAHARACSILAKAGFAAAPKGRGDMVLDADERALARKLGEYAETVEKAARELLPHYICGYLYELAQEFNRFYEKCRIVGDEREDTRLWLVSRYQEALGAGLELLGIVAPSKM